MDEELDVTKLKYVLYARKSTDDPQRQVRSIPDQIYDCQLLISRLNLNVVATIQETKSAKKPNQRPEFTQILKDLKSGKYDGIIAWHPDRLARNMKEGGEVIDMIDEGYIQDLKFVTHHFSNDPNGKMLLGMSFVLSKQYSDDLSQKVTRGVRGNLLEGKSSGTPKHGYIRDERGLYVPDHRTFETIKEAWEKRKNGNGLDSIADFLKKKDYYRLTRDGRKIYLNDKTLSVLFRDPFYYGILVQTGQNVDLRNLYDFVPTVLEKDYWEVQSLSQRRKSPYKAHRATFYPLKAMIICKYCNRNMYIGPSTGGSKNRYLNARCDTKGCARNKKSLRMKVVFEFIYKVLEGGLNFSQEQYVEYYNSIADQSEAQREQSKIELHSKQGLVSALNKEITERSLSLTTKDFSQTVIKQTENKIVDLEVEKEKLTKEIEEIQKTLKNPSEVILSIDEFLNLSKNAAAVVKAADSIVKDTICRIIFLNFTVDEYNVLSYQLKEPFDTLLKTRNSVSGRVEAEDFEPLTTAILTHWKSPKIDWDNVILSERNIYEAKSEFGFKYYY